MAVKSIGFFLDRLKTSFRNHVCGVCQKNPIFTPNDLICPACQKRLLMRQPMPVSKMSGIPLYAACGFPFSIKRMLYDLKFHDKTQNGTLLAEVLAHYWQQVPESQHKDWLVLPIPPHKNAGHAHMPLISRPFASHFGYDFVEHGLTWNRDVVHQHTLLNRRKRHDNMSGALTVDPVFARKLTGRHRILIADDLLTTGATLGEAIAAIRRVNPMIQVCTLTVSQVPFAIPRQEQKQQKSGPVS